MPTAQLAYGYQANIPGPPQVLPNANGVAPSWNDQQAVLGSANARGLSVHFGNPFFWALIIALIFVGYLAFGFDVKLRRIGKVDVQAGR